MNIMFIGAHPDDCEYYAAGTAVKLASRGHHIMMLSVSNGDAGHHVLGREELARIRRQEIADSDSLLGVEGDALSFHDGEIVPSLEIRHELIRRIRAFNADIVVSHRPNDYHPDHRNTGLLVQDTAYLVIVPAVCPDTPALRHNPVYLYMMDTFRSPEPFRPDVIVPVDDVWDRKLDAIDAMPSQFYEWLPWTEGKLDDVPENIDDRKKWLDAVLRTWLANPFKAETRALFGETVDNMEMIEAFQLCEYGRQPSLDGLRKFFDGLANSV